MTTEEIMSEWLNHPDVDEQTKAEIQSFAHDQGEVNDRFLQYVTFGTGGIRALLGAGTNRINLYTIRRATQGLSNYICKQDNDPLKGVVIAYDSRHQSELLAKEAACTLVANGIKVFLFDGIRPTPELSFAVRKMGAAAGIVITASHNPATYNGYKVYGSDGGQITSGVAKDIAEEIASLGTFQGVKTASFAAACESGLLHTVGEEMDQLYLSRLADVTLQPERLKECAADLSIVYSPLHGTGIVLVPKALSQWGFANVHVVQEQAVSDPEFSTVRSPNPEEDAAFSYALSLAEAKQGDVILLTDPDCDRVGVMSKSSSGEYIRLTGNQVGALLLDYVLSAKARAGKLQERSAMITTIVTSEIGSAIAAKYGVETIKTLTGFKYIAEWIQQFEEEESKTFVFGYEESCGYLADPFVREKDGVMASALICEMAAFYKQQGKTLVDKLQDIYTEHGYYLEATVSRTLEGTNGQEKMKGIMKYFDDCTLHQIGEREISHICKYQQQTELNVRTGEHSVIRLPKENAIQFRLVDGAWFCIRPSGTEPKLKIYFSVQATSEDQARKKMSLLQHEVMKRIDDLL